MTSRDDMPAPPAVEAGYARAAKRFKEFKGRDPHKGEIVFIRDRGTVALVVGELDGVIYRSSGRERGRIHRFGRSSRPLLLVSSDGRTAYIVRGQFRFNARGFIG